MDYKDIYKEWLSNPYFDEDTKKELQDIADNDNEIKERFYMDLEFGNTGSCKLYQQSGQGISGSSHCF